MEIVYPQIGCLETIPPAAFHAYKTLLGVHCGQCPIQNKTAYKPSLAESILHEFLETSHVGGQNYQTLSYIMMHPDNDD